MIAFEVSALAVRWALRLGHQIAAAVARFLSLRVACRSSVLTKMNALTSHIIVTQMQLARTRRVPTRVLATAT
jgi:hypothetical protein